MTYKQFEEAVKKFKPNAVVSKHGDYCSNKSKTTLGIYFIREDGTHSKVYDYSGTYMDVLCSLGIGECVTSKEVLRALEDELERAKKQHGKRNLFLKDKVIDNTEKIKKLEEQIEHEKTLYCVN